MSIDWASGKKNTIISALGYSRKGDKSWYEVWNPKSFSHTEDDKLGLICARVHARVSKVFTFAHFLVLKLFGNSNSQIYFVKKKIISV